MNPATEVYEMLERPTLQCIVKGRVTLAGAVMEVHQYKFHGRQEAIFSQGRDFLDLALTRRPGQAVGGYADCMPSRSLGDILYVPAGTQLHAQWGEGQQTSICCAFDRSTLGKGDAFLPSDVLDAALDVRCPTLQDVMRKTAQEILAPGLCSDMLVQAMWIQIYVELKRHFFKVADAGMAPAGGLSRAQLQNIIDRIEQPGRLPSIANLAMEHSVSPRHFLRLFKQTTGKTIVRYATEIRVRKAKELLAAGKAIKAISWECGFDTPEAFAAAFKKNVGMSPTEYRKQLLV